jgi:hypothetical protein
MIDPMVPLAFSVYSQKGVYALLLGSGVSRASQIPTGWEVVLDLIAKVAALQGEDPQPDPVSWFRNRHGAEPDYSKLLDLAAKTPTERQQLLRGYFEPSEEERKQGLKVPSAAHKAISQLAGAGYIRIIITTNFDRLMERALEEAGVTPTVISTADQIAGALPLAHSGVTVIKLHGDYLDTRIRNTEAELACYDSAFDSLLNRILDEYGLIVCGWSAEWDNGLRAAIERCPSRRFTTYWSVRSALGDRARRLVEHRRAEVLQPQTANQLFESLWEKVRALEDIARPHPLSPKMAVATLKRYLPDPAAKIRLRDLIHEETEKLVAQLTEEAFPASTALEPNEELGQRTAKYEALCEVLLSLLVTGCYWGEATHSKLWIEALQRVTNSAHRSGGLTYLNDLSRYPALFLSYGAGIAAVAAAKYETLCNILTAVKAKSETGEPEPFCAQINAISVIGIELGRLLPGMERRHTPVSDHLFERLRSILKEYIPEEEAYNLTFDRFEYLLALVHADICRQVSRDGSWWGPIGRFSWRGQLFGQGGRIVGRVANEIQTEGANWAPVKGGLFNGSIDQAKAAVAQFGKFLNQIHFR